MKIKTLFIQISLLALLLSVISCKSDGDKGLSPSDIAEQNLRGQIEGIAWNFVSGKAAVSYFDSTELSIELYSVQPDSVCDRWSFPEGDRMLFSIPAQAGDYQLSFTRELQRTVTFYDQEQELNVIGISGIVSVYEITTEVVSLGMNVSALDGKNSVNGKCTVPLCE